MAEHQGNENPLPSPPPFCSDDHESDVLSPSKRSKLDEAEHDGAGSSPDCEVEIVKKDEFDFLDGMTRLATLESGIATDSYTSFPCSLSPPHALHGPLSLVLANSQAVSSCKLLYS